MEDDNKKSSETRQVLRRRGGGERKARRREKKAARRKMFKNVLGVLAALFLTAATWFVSDLASMDEEEAMAYLDEVILKDIPLNGLSTIALVGVAEDNETEDSVRKRIVNFLMHQDDIVITDVFGDPFELFVTIVTERSDLNSIRGYEELYLWLLDNAQGKSIEKLLTHASQNITIEERLILLGVFRESRDSSALDFAREQIVSGDSLLKFEAARVIGSCGSVDNTEELQAYVNECISGSVSDIVKAWGLISLAHLDVQLAKQTLPAQDHIKSSVMSMVHHLVNALSGDERSSLLLFQLLRRSSSEDEHEDVVAWNKQTKEFLIDALLFVDSEIGDELLRGWVEVAVSGDEFNVGNERSRFAVLRHLCMEVPEKLQDRKMGYGQCYSIPFVGMSLVSTRFVPIRVAHLEALVRPEAPLRSATNEEYVKLFAPQQTGMMIKDLNCKYEALVENEMFSLPRLSKGNHVIFDELFACPILYSSTKMPDQLLAELLQIEKVMLSIDNIYVEYKGYRLAGFDAHREECSLALLRLSLGCEYMRLLGGLVYFLDGLDIADSYKDKTQSFARRLFEYMNDMQESLSQELVDNPLYDWHAVMLDGLGLQKDIKKRLSLSALLKEYDLTIREKISIGPHIRVGK